MQVPVHGKVDVVQDLLHIIYGLSEHNCNVDSIVAEHMHDRQPHLQAMLQLAQQYSMPSFLQLVDAALVQQLECTTGSGYMKVTKYLRSIEEAVSWLIALHDTDMPQCTDALLSQIANNFKKARWPAVDTISTEQLTSIATTIGADLSMKLLRAALEQFSVSGATNEWACNSYVQEKCMHLCDVILASRKQYSLSHDD